MSDGPLVLLVEDEAQMRRFLRAPTAVSLHHAEVLAFIRHSDLEYGASIRRV